MIASDINPVELKVFLNHIYELKKGFNPEIIELIGEFDYVINPVVYYGYKLALKGYKFVKKFKK